MGSLLGQGFIESFSIGFTLILCRAVTAQTLSVLKSFQPTSISSIIQNEFALKVAFCTLDDKGASHDGANIQDYLNP